MTLNETLRRLQTDGGCVLEGVIPEEKVAEIRESVLREELRQRAEWEAEAAKIKGAGHHPPPSGIGHAQALINYVPQIAPYLADRRIIETAETLFGPFFRISSISGLVSHPGNERGYWHADWPFNQTLAAHVQIPYQDAVLQLSVILMLTDFSAETGGTLIVPGSHRAPDNPTGDNGVDRHASYPTEMHVTGRAGSAFFYDSRLWHAAGTNRSDKPRVAITVRYSPWWINLEVKRKGSPDHTQIIVETNGKDNSIPLVPRNVFESLPEKAKLLFRHWVED